MKIERTASMQRAFVFEQLQRALRFLMYARRSGGPAALVRRFEGEVTGILFIASYVEAISAKQFKSINTLAVGCSLRGVLLLRKERADEQRARQVRAGVSANGSGRSSQRRIEAHIGSSSLPVVSAELHEGVLSAQRSDACAAADAVPAGV